MAAGGRTPGRIPGKEPGRTRALERAGVAGRVRRRKAGWPASQPWRSGWPNSIWSAGGVRP